MTGPTPRPHAEATTTAASPRVAAEPHGDFTSASGSTPLRALIWDVDGTLAETEEHGHRIAFNEAFEEAGLPWRWDRALYGELLAVAGGKERLRLWWRRLHGDGSAPDEALIAQLQQRKTAFYLARLQRGDVQLRPGVARLVHEARQAGLAQAIATTTTPANVTRLLELTLGPEAPGWFAAIGAGDMVPAKKPAPDVYRWVLQRLGLAPHEALAIEDSAVGARAALAAGVPVVVCRSAYTVADAMPAGLRTDRASLDGVALADLRRWHAAPPADAAG